MYAYSSFWHNIITHLNVHEKEKYSSLINIGPQNTSETYNKCTKCNEMLVLIYLHKYSDRK